MESLIRDKMIEYLEKQNLISDSQHGFLALCTSYAGIPAQRIQQMVHAKLIRLPKG